MAPARLATPARAAPSRSPAGAPDPSQASPAPDWALGGGMGAASGRGSDRRSLATDPLPARSNAPHPCRGRMMLRSAASPRVRMLVLALMSTLVGKVGAQFTRCDQSGGCNTECANVITFAGMTFYKTTMTITTASATERLFPCVPRVGLSNPIYKRIPVLPLQHRHMGDRYCTDVLWEPGLLS